MSRRHRHGARPSSHDPFRESNNAWRVPGSGAGVAGGAVLIDHFPAALRRILGAQTDRDAPVPASPSTATRDSAPDRSQARRDRDLGLPEELLRRALAQKVLDGWLGNRNQVLVPLTLRLGRLRADDVELLMRFAAASLLVASPGETEARPAMTRWLRSIGALDEALAVFDRSLQAPTALSTLLDRAQSRQLEPYVYAIATRAADLRAVSGRLYADFVAARLALPPDAVRSINRRFRR